MRSHEVLERAWAEWNELDPRGMVVCSSGTAALHLALEALDLPDHTRCLVPDYTMIACARAVTLAGLEDLEFVDCRDDLLLDSALLPPGYGHPTMILPVHVYGRRCDMDAIAGWRSNWASTPSWVVEDLAEAHGVRPHPQTDAACWSFYRNKIVHGEEGGAVYFLDPEVARRARSLRSLGFTDDHDYWHIPRGHNYRLSDSHAELILESLYDARKNLEARGMVESWYEEATPAEWRMPRRESPWVYDLRIRGTTYERQNQLVTGLRAAGIDARHGFKPCSMQPEYRRGENCENVNAQLASQEVIYLPLKPWMHKQETTEFLRKVEELL